MELSMLYYRINKPNILEAKNGFMYICRFNEHFYIQFRTLKLKYSREFAESLVRGFACLSEIEHIELCDFKYVDSDKI